MPSKRARRWRGRQPGRGEGQAPWQKSRADAHQPEVAPGEQVSGCGSSQVVHQSLAGSRTLPRRMDYMFFDRHARLGRMPQRPLCSRGRIGNDFFMSLRWGKWPSFGWGPCAIVGVGQDGGMVMVSVPLEMMVFSSWVPQPFS